MNKALSILKGNHLRGDILLSTVSGVATTKSELVELFDKKIPAIDVITTKSFQVKPNPGNREPVVCSPKEGDFGNSVGLRNPGMEAAYPELKELREKGLRAILNVSVSASTPEDFITLVKKFDDIADMIELNFSCPHASAGFGASIGCDINIASEYTKIINEATKDRKSLLIIKLTPNVDDIGSIAKAVIDAGADGIAAINTVGPNLYLEKNSGSPILNNKLGGKGGASGEWVKGKALKCIREIREAIGDEPIILGMGGVSDEMDARAMILAGADSVGIGSAFSRVEPSMWQNWLQCIKDNGRASKFLSKGNKLEYTPHEVLSAEKHGEDIIILELSGEIDCHPGEFAFLWVPGKGEKPFSIARNNPLTFLIKKRGQFTTELFDIKKGDTVYTRGLYGKPMAIEKSEKALLIAGGSGVAVLPLIAERLQPMGTKMDIRVGIVKESEGLDPLEDVLSSYGQYKSIADDGKPGRVLDSITADDISGDTICYVVGPGKMMEIAAKKLADLGQDKSRILLSMEKNTMCGIGMCGECVCGGKLPCKEGTFYTWKELEENGAKL
ncbi:MAG: dihydroorotate dehydrogenase [Spirochaetales bacterium]|nr:dihydroorotate dehydrogenase [Spirochaetales bacterium]